MNKPVDKRKNSLPRLPIEVSSSLIQMGQHLKTIRKNRRVTMQEASDRLQINRDTLRRLESGDSGIAVGTWLSALWLYNRLEDVVDVMDPAKDPVGMSLLRQGLANRPRLDDDF